MKERELSHTYFVQAIGTDMIKIGMAKSVFRRIQSLQTSCPHELQLLGVSTISESKIHEKFLKYKTKNEWYKLSPEIETFIVENTFIPEHTETSKNWSIQLSLPTANYLKEYCKSRGFKMNWFVEKSLHLCMSGSLIKTVISGSYGK